MKHIFSLILIFSGACAAVKAQDLKAEMQVLARTFQDANNRADVDALNALYTEEVILVDATNGSRRILKRAQIKTDDIQKFSTVNDQINILVESATLMPDGRVKVTGVVTGFFTDKKSGEKTNYSGKYEHYAVKEDERWKLHEMKFMPE